MAEGAQTYCILLSDIAGSSRLAEAHGRAYDALLEQHNALSSAAVAAHGGTLYKHLGDGVLALFPTADACVRAALVLGVSLAGLPPLADGESLRVRIALHAGSLRQSGGEYYGPPLNRAARICQVLAGGQVVASGALLALLGSQRASFHWQALGLNHLRDLAEPEELFGLDDPGFALHEFPPLQTLGERPNNLLAQPNRFIGRGKELAELEGRLFRAAAHQGARLVSIIAPGGYGKSRLAAQLCAQLLPQFSRGAFIVPLAGVRNASEVPLATAQALGFPLAAGRTPEAQLCEYLRRKELLLCFDNFEHLPEAAPLVSELLRTSPALRILITSREPLRLEGELVYRLEPIGLSEEGGAYSDAELLFADRAALVDPAFALSSANRGLVRAICGKLEGIPLAIELAAAWMDGFTLAEMNAALAGQLELEARSSDRPARHQSLKACLDWSWELLDSAQRDLLMRLSVFRGGFFTAAAEALVSAGPTLRPSLLRLCDKGWLYAREVGGQTRFYLRDMLAHEYAGAKLRASPAAEAGEGGPYASARASHAAYYSSLAEREGARLSGAGTPDGGSAQLDAAAVWRLEFDNISAALETALEQEEPVWLLALARSLLRYLQLVSAYSLLQRYYLRLEEAGRQSGSEELLLAALLGLSSARWRLSEYEAAEAGYLECLALAQKLGLPKEESMARASLGNIALMRGDFDLAEEALEEASALRRQIGDSGGEARILSSLGTLHFYRGKYARAAEAFEKNRLLCRSAGDRHGEIQALGNLGHIHNLLGHPELSEELQQQALAFAREFGDRQIEAVTLGNLGILCAAQGRLEEAIELQTLSHQAFVEVGARFGEATALATLGQFLIQADRPAEALGPLREAIETRLEIGDKPGLIDACGFTGAALAALGRCAAAALALYGAQHCAAGHESSPEPGSQLTLDSGLERLELALDEQGIAAPVRQSWRDAARELSPDELARRVLAELELPLGLEYSGAAI